MCAAHCKQAINQWRAGAGSININGQVVGTSCRDNDKTRVVLLNCNIQNTDPAPLITIT